MVTTVINVLVFITGVGVRRQASLRQLAQALLVAWWPAHPALYVSAVVFLCLSEFVADVACGVFERIAWHLALQLDRQRYLAAPGVMMVLFGAVADTFFLLQVVVKCWKITCEAYPCVHPGIVIF